MSSCSNKDNDRGNDCAVKNAAGDRTTADLAGRDINNNAILDPNNANIKAGANKTLLRYQKDVNLYQKEIEELKDQLANESDPYKARQIGKMLLETQHVLTDVLMKMEKYK